MVVEKIEFEREITCKSGQSGGELRYLNLTMTKYLEIFRKFFVSTPAGAMVARVTSNHEALGSSPR